MYVFGNPGGSLHQLMNPSPSPASQGPENPFVKLFQQKLQEQQGANRSNIWYAETGNQLVVRWAGPSAKTRGPLLKIADVKWEFWRYSDATVRSLASKLNQAGFLSDPNASRESVWDAFRHVLMDAAQRYAAQGGSAPTVQQVLNSYLANPIGDAAASAKKPQVYTQTQRSVNLTDPKAAAAMLSEVLQERLGRAPTPAERNAFVAALNAAEEANPVVTKTTYRLNPESDTYDSDTRTTGGVDPAGFLQTYAEKHNQKEYGAYQAATTYMNAFMQAIGAPIE